MIPTTRVVIDEENPWPGLAAFDESAERFFNGRADESAALRRLVGQAPLTVLFGASGLGKSSLLQAGLFPLLRRDHYLPIYIRLDVRDGSGPLIEQVKRALTEQVAMREVDEPPPGDESLWAYLHRTDLELWSRQNYLLTPVFVFDQFEEVFTLGAENPPAIARLRIDLANLIENRMPAELADAASYDDASTMRLALDTQRYKVLVSFREDFLPAVEGWKRDIPSLLRNRLRLLPMSGEQALQAVHDTGGRLVDEPLARAIVRFVAAARHEEMGEQRVTELADLALEPALLSLLCHGLNEERKAQRKPAFDEALLTGKGKAIIFDYYARAVAGMPKPVHRFLERELITERGFRKSCDVDDARSVHGVSDADLRVLVDRRLLRIEPQRGTEHVELTHDLLTRVVRVHRDRDRERRRRWRLAAFSGVGLVLVGLVGLFASLYFDARAQRQRAVAQEGVARQAVRDAQIEFDKANAARNTAERVSAELQDAGQRLVTAANVAEAARNDAERQAANASAQRLATEALYQFGHTREQLALSGALAAASYKIEPTAEGLKALNQVVRLMAPPPRLLPKVHSDTVRGVALSRDGRWMASAGEDRRVVLWSRSDPGQRTVLEVEDSIPPSGIAFTFSPDGEWLAIGGMRGLWVWRLAGPAAVTLLDHEGLARSVSFSVNGRTMATAARDGVVRLFDRQGERWVERSGVKLADDEGTVSGVGFLDETALATAGERGFAVWDTAAPATPPRRTSERGAVDCRAFAVNSDEISNKIRMSAICQGGRVMAVTPNVDAGLREETLAATGLASASWALAQSADGRYIAAGDNDGTVHVYGKGTERELTTLATTATSLAFSRDGTELAVGLRDGGIALWPMAKGMDAVRLDFGSAQNLSPGVAVRGVQNRLSSSPDGHWLVTTGKDGVVTVVDVSTPARPTLARSWRLGEEVFRSFFSPDGNLLAVLGATRVHVFQTRAWKMVTSIEMPSDDAYPTFTPDGRQLPLVVQGSGVRRFDTVTWRPLTPSLPGPLRRAAVSPDGRHVGTVRAISRPRSREPIVHVRIWSLATGHEVAWSEPRSNDPAVPASSRAEHGGDQQLIKMFADWKAEFVPPTGSWKAAIDGRTASLLEASTGRVVSRFEHDADLDSAEISPRGGWLATVTEAGVGRLWPLDPADVLASACRFLPRNLTPQEWTGYQLARPYVKTCPNLP